MKTNHNFLAPLGTQAMASLMQEVVAETIANESQFIAKKKFCSADLWKIQRQRKTRNIRRQLA